ncbi:MAG TPA: hypothetical protein PLM48_08550 [Clostridia bacterium]|nr:hypothetical protein [Clostridia bacterium]
MTSKDIAAIENTGYLTESINLSDLFSEEMDGLTPTFDRIRIPAGGGISYEVPGDDPSSPDMAKDFNAVILYHHPIFSFYTEKFNGGSQPPECASMDGHVGIDATTGECRDCKACPFAKFGSGENGGMACKQKRRVYLLRENELLPVILTVPTGSLKEFTKYVTRLLQKGKKTNQVVTRFSLQKAQNSTGIAFSQVVCSVARPLTPEEQASIHSMSEQVKAYAGHVAITDAE